MTFDDAGAEIDVRERHVDERDVLDGGQHWERYIPFSAFNTLDPATLAVAVQFYRNAQAEQNGWDVRDTSGVTSEPEPEEPAVITKEQAIAAQNVRSEATFKDVCRQIDAGIVNEYDPTSPLAAYGFNVHIDLDDPIIRRRVLDLYGKEWEVEYRGSDQKDNSKFLHFK